MGEALRWSMPEGHQKYERMAILILNNLSDRETSVTVSILSLRNDAMFVLSLKIMQDFGIGNREP